MLNEVNLVFLKIPLSQCMLILVTDCSTHCYFLQCIQFLTHPYEYCAQTPVLDVLGGDCQIIYSDDLIPLSSVFIFKRRVWHNKTDALRWSSGHSTWWLSWRQWRSFCLQGFRWTLGTPGSGELGLNTL